MPAYRKEQLDKAAWAWADGTDPKLITDENIFTAYRVKLPKCKPATCRLVSKSETSRRFGRECKMLVISCLVL